MPGERRSEGVREGADSLFTPIVTTDELLCATSGRAWLQAMLDVEAALARAEAEVGLVPADAAESIAAACTAGHMQMADLGARARLGGNPVIPLVETLIAEVPGAVGRWVHWGATSQDILDSATVLVAKRACGIVDRDLGGLTDACAALASRHRATLMPGRTLLQHALPITFGLKAAGWLVSARQARDRLRAAGERLPAQLGGAAGTLASLGPDGPAVLRGLAQRLDLAEPILPWHTNRLPIADLAGALGMVAGMAAKIAYDVALMMQTEVAEAFEPSAPGRGGSSTLPHKRNPVGAAAVGAAARRAHGLVAVVLGGMVQEHERALGGWQAEWETLTDLLRLAGGAAARVRETVVGLEVDERRMRENLEITRGLLMAERVSLALSGILGRSAAREAVRAAAQRTNSSTSFAAQLRRDPAVAAALSEQELEKLLDPTGYLGSTQQFIERALEDHRRGGKRSE